MNIQEKETEIIEEFSIYDDWMDKYAYIIELGKELPLIDEDKKTKERLIVGCQSQVWLDAEHVDGKMRFTADSDAIITKGIIALLIRVVNDESPAEIAKYNFDFIQEIGLQEHLSPTRSNGLVGMVKDIKLNALKAMKA
ncbi:MAG: SufE family protein [Brumimicrobium sp.]|nr:SufE family protein [Brumimicrobium sp.]